MKGFRRNLVLALVWLVGLFVVDAVDSYFSLIRSTKRIRSDDETVALLESAVVEYVIQCAASYLLVGLMVGVVLHLLIRVYHPQMPGFRRGILSGLGTLALGTTIMVGWQITGFPTMYDWFPARAWLVENLQPSWWLWMGGAIFAGLLFLSWRRWTKANARGFGRRLAALALALGAIFLALQPLRPDTPQKNQGTNVVLLGIDALRPDRLSYYGHDRPTSPNIDAVLKESVIFEQAFTQLPRTYPAWITTLSGAWPTTHGIRDNLPTDDKIIPDLALLPQVMKEAGYATGFATDDSRFSYMVPESGFDMILQPEVGLANFALSINEPRFRTFHALLHNPLGFSMVPVQAYNQSFGKSYRPHLFNKYVVDGLAKLSQSERFFYAIHSCVLHAPGDRVHPWNNMYGQKGYRGRNRFKYSSSGSQMMVAEIEGVKGEKAKRIATQDNRIYDSGIAMADALVGDVVQSLKDSGLWDNTILVLFSDHGEELWDTDLPYKWYGPNHGFHVYGDGHLNVLMSIRFPDGQLAGEQVRQPVRLIDFAPTVAEMVGLKWPNPMDGKSMLAVARGEESQDRLVYAETGLSEPRYWVKGHKRYPFKKVSKRYSVSPETGRVHIRPKFRNALILNKERAVQMGDYKLIWHSLKKGMRVDLFNRREDVLNRVDLSEDHPEKVEELGALMMPFLTQDGITPPPLSEWVEQSRRPKRSDKKWRERMQRQGGTLPPPPGTRQPASVEGTAPEGEVEEDSSTDSPAP